MVCTYVYVACEICMSLLGSYIYSMHICMCCRYVCSGWYGVWNAFICGWMVYVNILRMLCGMHMYMTGCCACVCVNVRDPCMYVRVSM